MFGVAENGFIKSGAIEGRLTEEQIEFQDKVQAFSVKCISLPSSELQKIKNSGIGYNEYLQKLLLNSDSFIPPPKSTIKYILALRDTVDTIKRAFPARD
ncbi:MAG: hypothetical protein LBN19_01540 [Endomicrobium sp.]|nr:hypothetical protein [Endomicrobium sp.]